MEISRMLTISTCHMSKETNIALQSGEDIGVVVYEKEDSGILFGYFILALGYDDTDESIPNDIKQCLELALEHDCEWLCLDCDGEVLDTLPTYDW